MTLFATLLRLYFNSRTPYLKYMLPYFSRITRKQVKRDIREMRNHIRRHLSTPSSARGFLVKCGILSKSGKHLAKAYR